MLAAGLILVVVSLVSCERSVGVGDGDGGTNPDAGVGPDSGGQTDAQVGEFLQDIVGWRATAFEHTTFVPEDLVDEAALDACNAYVTAREGEERWWATGGGEDTLGLFPWVDGMERLGLMVASGWLSLPGSYGHEGWYQRSFELTEWELLVCPTVERLGHCPMPRPADLCVLPEQQWYETVETYLARIVPGPGSMRDHYELTVTFNPNVMDGTTVFHLSFALPQARDPWDEWESFEGLEIEQLNLREERLWAYYLEIYYPHDHDGWVMRNLATDTLKVSLSGRSGDGETVHVWGDFPVDEVIYTP
jgi:hypothetical protein